MALTDFPPIPAELVGDAPPLSDDELEAYFAFVDEQASEAAVDPETVDEWLTTSQDEGIVQSVAARVAHWRVEDDGAAEWALRKLAAAQAEVEQLRLQSEDWTARITAWFTQASKRPAQLSAKMEALLERYALERREETGAATLTLPSGVVSTREQKPAAVIEDEETVAVVVQAALDVELAFPQSDDVATPWADAFRSSEIGAVEQLVVWRPKVYADPFRKLVRVEPFPTGIVEWTVRLACGHEELVTGDAEETTVPEVSEILTCVACSDDETVTQAVAAVTAQPLMELTVLGPDDRPVSGAAVRPGEVKASVKAR